MILRLKLQGPRWPSDKVLASAPRAPGPKPDFTEDPRRKLACCTPNHTQGPSALPLVRRGNLERERQSRRRPRHLSAVQYYDVRPKLALVLLQSEKLI
ncbi:hypothetical protein AVEN_254706-1 [Araneus ventricosus]|uniref:Uncharacterized protein n=1 Tax=Araneus ventricosus TaxID=182803 RepID=A0A4Y2K841_ARAVE|nr:hypothetical protein AVEN_254706-1 [Araneus ventricosus]